MDENQFDEQLNNYIEKSEPENIEEDDFGKTQEMNSIQMPKLSDGETRGITPRDEFTEMNSSDDMSKTLLMDSVGNDAPVETYLVPQNPVKKRRRKHKKKQINHTRTMGQIFLGVVISVGALGLGVFLSIKVVGAIRDVTGLSKPHIEYEFEITEDMGVDQIIEKLHAAGIIDMPSLLKSYIKIKDRETGFLNGFHTLSANMSYSDIISTLQSVKSYTSVVDVSIPEGLTAAAIGKLLEENLVCRAVDFENYYKAKLNSYDFEEGIETNPNRLNMLEGYIFPDTYNFYVIDDLKEHPNLDTSHYAKLAAEKMFENFENRISKEMKARMTELDMTLDEVIILASLIQWEGTNEENMAMISSVFHNRLNDPETFPMLQSDTTYTYIDECIKPKITPSNNAKMQQIIDAYDTYKCDGLPAGAICNPGLDAINAALYPAESSYYYFLASKDGDFYYAKTLAEHEQNILDAALHEGA